MLVHTVLHDCAEVIGAIGWPIVALVGLIALRGPLGGFIGKLAARVETAGKLSIGRDGLNLEGQVAENATRIETLEVSQGVAQARMAAAPHGAKLGLVGDVAAAPPASIPPALADDAAAYRAIVQPDDATRLGSKNAAADAMAAYVVTHAVPRALLAQSTDEGLIVALATAIIAHPATGDTALLLQAAPRVTRKHVAYRVVLAFSQLLTRSLVAQPQLAEIRTALARFSTFADPPLNRAIARTLLALR